MFFFTSATCTQHKIKPNCNKKTEQTRQNKIKKSNYSAKQLTQPRRYNSDKNNGKKTSIHTIGASVHSIPKITTENTQQLKLKLKTDTDKKNRNNFES